MDERLMSKVVWNGDEDECWTWEGAQIKGYGAMRMGERTVYAHRVAYELFVGPIPEGLEIDHLCRVRNCVNPAHLEPVTHAENVRRGDTYASGAPRRAVTHCPQGHPYAGENLYIDSRGRRRCRTCRRAEGKRRQNRKDHPDE